MKIVSWLRTKKPCPCNLLLHVPSMDFVFLSRRNQTIWWNKLVNFLKSAPTNQKQEDNKRLLYVFRLFLRLPNVLWFRVIRLQVWLYLNPHFALRDSAFWIAGIESNDFPVHYLFPSIIRLIWIDMLFLLILVFLWLS